MAEFVDIASLADVSNSFPAQAWMQVSGTQKVDITKLFNSANFVSGLKGKLGIPDVLSTKLNGFSAGSSYAALAATDTVLQAFNKIQGNFNKAVKWTKEVWSSGALTLKPNTIHCINDYDAGVINVGFESSLNKEGDSAIIVITNISKRTLEFQSDNAIIWVEKTSKEIISTPIEDAPLRIICAQVIPSSSSGIDLVVNAAYYE